MKIRRINSLASLDLRDYVQRVPDVQLPFGALAYTDFTKDNRIRRISTTARELNGLTYEYGSQSISNGTGPYVPANDRTSVLNGEVAYTFEFTDARILGLRVPSASRNLAFGSNNFGGSSWTRTNMTVSSVASPNTATSATRVTATANNASVTQARTGISATRRFFVFARSATSANVTMHMTLNNFSTVQSFNVTRTWTQFGLTATQATPTLGIRLPDSGTSVDLWAADYETGSAAIDTSEVLINTTIAGSATLNSSSVSYSLPEFLPDDVTPRKEATIYHEVFPRRGGGTTSVAVNCELNQSFGGELFIAVSDNDITLTGSDFYGDAIDYLTILNDDVCRISILYTRATQELFVMINDELIGPYVMGFPVSVSHLGNSVTGDRAQHYIRKIGLWERVLQIGELRALWNGYAE